MNCCLVVVDMQNDFVTGCLGSAAAQAVEPYIRRAVEKFDGEVVFTRDTHCVDYMNTQEGRRLPVEHCIRGSEGWELTAGLAQLSEGRRIIDKPGFGSEELAAYLKEIDAREHLDEVWFMGVCTDICVISNAYLVKAALPEARIVIDARGCAGTSIANHKNALRAMGACQMDILGAEEDV